MESKSAKTQVPNMEPFYEAMEQNSNLLEEAFEVMLVMVASDPASSKNLAVSIRNEYPTFFNQLVELAPDNREQDDKPSCCGGH